MFLTNILLKKAKSKNIMVVMESLVSGHKFNMVRERLAEKLEVIRFDPYIQEKSIYKERKKIKSIKILHGGVYVPIFTPFLVKMFAVYSK